MALDKQVKVISVTDAEFDFENERVIRNKIHKIKRIIRKAHERLESKKFKDKPMPFNHQYIKILKKLKNEAKSNLIAEFKKNTAIRELREQDLYRVDKNTGEIIIKNKYQVSIFDSDLLDIVGAELDQLFTDIVIVETFFMDPVEQIFKNNFVFNGETYIFLTASAGQIRTKKNVFIKESTWMKHHLTITCGLDIETINQKGGVNSNKYLAYSALSNSATDKWDDFDINKAIVVEDFETTVTGFVDYIDVTDYSIARKLMDISISHSDGFGIMLNQTSRMIRLPWIKGLLGEVPFDVFLQEHGLTNCVIKDIYGKEWDIIGDDIQYILVKSQFKMWKYYDNWEDYKDKFKKYKCNARYCNIEEPYIKSSKINYQMLQSLHDMTREEMTKLAQKTVDDINNIGKDYSTMMRVLGVDSNRAHQSHMQQALSLYPELMRDVYNRDILSAVKRKLVKNAKAGKIDLAGKYTFVMPDVYAFMEWLFLGIEKPLGLLSDGQVSCNMYADNKELDCLRAPHLYREHAIRNNVINEKTRKYFVSKGVYVSSYDLISKIVMCDWDGDRLLIIENELFVDITKKHMKDVVPLYYEMKKAPSTTINKDSLWDGITSAWRSGKVGEYSNGISKLSNGENPQLKLIALLTAESNFSIDSAKTLYMPPRPQWFNDELKPYLSRKLPSFFEYAKDYPKDKVEKPMENTMGYLDSIIPNSRLVIKNTVGKIDTKILMYDAKVKLNESHQYIIDKYNYIDRFKDRDYKLSEDKKYEDQYNFAEMRSQLLELDDINLIVDVLVKYLYDEKKARSKFILWEMFGDIILHNIKRNLPADMIVCKKCGKRFYPNTYHQQQCHSCLGVKEPKTRKIVCIDCGKQVEVRIKDTKTSRCSKCQKEYVRKYDRERKRLNSV